MFTADSVQVTTTTNIDSIARTINNVTLCGGNDGSVSINPLNGLSPFTYAWEGGEGINDRAENIAGNFVIDNLTQGTYRLTITDSSPKGVPLYFGPLWSMVQRPRSKKLK